MSTIAEQIDALKEEQKSIWEEQKRLTKLRREEQWDNEVIECSKHPGVRCQRSAYAHGKRECSACKNSVRSGVAKRRSKLRYRIKHRSEEALTKRAKRWESEFISCTNHPDRRCNRSRFVRRQERVCGSCHIRKADGKKRSEGKRRITPGLLERKKRMTRKRGYEKILKNRRQLKSKMSGIKLFERNTGLMLPEEWK